jgi:hypothetical protein
VSLLRGGQFYYDAPDGPGGPPARAAAPPHPTQAPNGSAPHPPANGGPAPPGEAAQPGAPPSGAPARRGTQR